jgi:serine/alanine adding enzyme
MFSIVTDHKLLDKNQWANFVANHPNGNIFHTPEIVKLYEATTKQKPVVVACLDKTNRIIGLLVAVIQKEYKSYIGNFTSRAIVWGGPLVIKDELIVVSLILASFTELCKREVVYSQFRNLWDCKFYNHLFTKNGYVFKEHLDIFNNITLSEDDLWKKINSNGRNKINKAIRQGTKVKLINEKTLLREVYAILNEVYNKAKLPVPDLNYFENAWDILVPLNCLKFFGAFNNGRLIGVRLELLFNKTVYDWYAGSLASETDKNPNDILPWEIIKWGATTGYETFDFGGAGKPGVPYGVRDFKMKFGGELVNYGRYEKVHKPTIMMLAKLGFNAWRLFK